MAVVNLKSTAVTNANALPRVQNSTGLENGAVYRMQALVTITSGDSATSTYRMFKIRSDDYIDRIRIDAPDIGTTTAADIGLYDLLTASNGGTVVDVDFFASAVSLNSGALSASDVTFEAAAAGGLIANAEKRVWECLGLSSDPGKEYDVALTLTGAADATGTALVRLYVVR